MASPCCFLTCFYKYLLSQNVSEDHILKIELDQRRYYKFRNPITLCKYIESIVRNRKDEKFYLFIDEVQLTMKVVDKENGGIEVTIYDMLNELKAYKNLTLPLSMFSFLRRSSIFPERASETIL